MWQRCAGCPQGVMKAMASLFAGLGCLGSLGEGEEQRCSMAGGSCKKGHARCGNGLRGGGIGHAVERREEKGFVALVFAVEPTKCHKTKRLLQFDSVTALLQAFYGAGNGI